MEASDRFLSDKVNTVIIMGSGHEYSEGLILRVGGLLRLYLKSGLEWSVGFGGV